MQGQLLGVFLLLCDKGASNRQTEQCICCQGCTYDKVLVRASVTYSQTVAQILKVVREVECEKETLSWDKWMLYTGGYILALYWLTMAEIHKKLPKI